MMAQQQMAKHQEQESLGDLFSELAAQTGELVRQEVALAQTEITNKASKAGKQIGYLVVGGAIGYAALLTIIAAVVIGLSAFIPLTLSAFIVGAVVAVVGYFMVSSAIEKLKGADLTPRKAVGSIKEDAEWLKNQIS